MWKQLNQSTPPKTLKDIKKKVYEKILNAMQYKHRQVDIDLCYDMCNIDPNIIMYWLKNKHGLLSSIKKREIYNVTYTKIIIIDFLHVEW